MQALEKYNEIEDDGKRDIFKNYIKLKGNIWMEWNDYNEENREDKEEENSEDESEEESENKGVTMHDQDG